MGQPEEGLEQQSPGKSGIYPKRNNESGAVGKENLLVNRLEVESDSSNIKLKLLSSPIKDSKDKDDDLAVLVDSPAPAKEKEEEAIHTHHPHHPRLGSESHDTVKNNSQESGLSSGCDCVSSSLSSSESFSGSEDISPQSSRREPLTSEGCVLVALGGVHCQEGIDVETQQGKTKQYEVGNDSASKGEVERADGHDGLDKKSLNPSTTVNRDVDQGESISANGENAESVVGHCDRESFVMEATSLREKEGEVFGGSVEGKVCKDSCPTRGEEGNQSETISAEVNSSQSAGVSTEQEGRKESRSSREKKRVFGLSGFGTRFNLNKIFSSTRPTHSSNERLNNQLSTHHSTEGAEPLASTTLLSNVSKSSSESNILMCHNSLDNLTDDLPSSRSTDSSCLIPTMTADDDQVLDHHQHHHHHHHHTNVVEETCQCPSCCTCCCCLSNGTCDHHLVQNRRIGNGCLSHPLSNRCSSSPATVGRRLQKSGNVEADGKDDDDDFEPDNDQRADDDCKSDENELGEETNNNNHGGDAQTPNNHFTTGNNSNLESGKKATCATPITSSSSGITVLRNQISNGEMDEIAPCGSSPNEGRDSCGNCPDGSAKTSDSLSHQSGNGIPTTDDSQPSPSPGNSSSESSSCNSYSEVSATSASSESCSGPSGAQASSSSQKFKLLSDGDVQVCRVKHGKNLVDKVIGSKLLRRWETHHLYLNDACISSKTPIGPMVAPVPYWQMEEVYVCVRLDSKRRYVIRIVIPDGSLLLQGSNAYVRDQWYYSILWKKNIYKYQNLMRSSKRPEVILKELKSLVNFATTTPLQDDCIAHVPVEIVSNLLDSAGDLLGKNQAEEVLVALSPLLERSHPPPSLCRFFSRYCRTRPRCPLVAQLFTPVVRRALKHNVDFGKYPYMRRFIQDYIQALNCHNDGINVVRNFVKSIHGPASSCPHPRVMSNLVSVCLAAMFQLFEKNSKPLAAVSMESINIKEIPYDEQLLCYLAIFDTISEFEDWRPSLAQLLQPIPFPDEALNNPLFTRSLSSVIRRIGTDHRCEVHNMVLGIRDGKEGWFHLYAPSNAACFDDGEMWGKMLDRLLACCCRRKRFLSQLGGKLLGSSMLLALRENAAAQEALCLLLEWQLVQSDDQRVQIATTLQSTPTGSANYIALCNRQLHLKELQQKGGPRKLTLPSRSTDKDLAKLLSCGSFGNLECLSLAFTQVTSACAEQLIKLPTLRYLNLWCTQFGDAGLQLISEHLPNLQVLNLCETPVTDKGLLCLTCMTSLRKLNLNSTHLSVQTFESLKKQLPALKEIDVRYTDAW